MTYLSYILLLENLDRVQPLSPGATRLYVKLLALVNGMRRADGSWPAQFAGSDPYVSTVCRAAINTMKGWREELEARGLLRSEEGGIGRGKTRTYWLLDGSAAGIKVSEIDALPIEKASGIDTIAPEKASIIDSFNHEKASEIDALSPESLEKVSGKVSKIDTLYKEKEKENIGAALAATPTPSLPTENSAISSAASPSEPAAKKTRKAGTAHAEIAALPLPHPGPDFAATWRTFYTENTKQAGKPLSAFELMLKKLGKYPEGFAVEMLEAAIQGNWSGVENGGTPQRYIDWQQRLRAAPEAGASPTPSRAPELNHEFIAEQEAAAAAQRAARFDHYATAATANAA